MMMKNQDDIRDQFSPLLDGELSPEERASVEAALSGDAELLRELDALKRVDDLFRALPAVTAPQDFEVAVRERIEPRRFAAAAAAPPRSHAPRRGYWPALAAAAALLVCVGAVMFTLNRANTPTQLALSSNAQSEVAMRTSADSLPTESPVYRDALSQSEMSLSPAPASEPLSAGSMGATRDAESLSAEPESLKKSEGDVAGEQPLQIADTSAAMNQLDEFGSRVAEEGAASIKREQVEPMVRAEAKPGIANRAEPPARVAGDKSDVGATAPPPATRGFDASASNQPAPVAMPEIAMAPAAPAAAPVPSEDTSAPPADSISGQLAQAVPKKAKERARYKATNESATRTIGERSFTQRDGVWYESGYVDQATVAVERDTPPLRNLIKKQEDVKELLAMKESVVFKVGDRWYKLSPAKP